MESSQYQPPVRRSLTDEELAARVQLATTSHSGVEALMDLLVAQEALRAQEDAEIEAWVIRMETEGTPEAIAALAKFQGQNFTPQTDQIITIPEQSAEQVQEIEQVSEPDHESDTQPEPVVEDPFAWLKPKPPVESEPEAEPEEPFTWFTQPETEDEVVIEEVVAVVEEVETAEEELHPEGTESSDEFERLIESAAAEEEMTALEEVSAVTGPSNILIPSDEHRNRKPISQLFIWLGASATVVPLLLTFSLLGIGLSAVSVIAVLALGYLISGLLIATATLAGKRSGLSTGIISRAVFGYWGNTVPMVFVTVARWVLAAVTIASLVYLASIASSGVPVVANSLWSIAGIKITVGFVVGVTVLTLGAVLALIKGSASRILQTVLSVGAFALVAESFIGYFQMKPAFSAPGQLGIISKEALAGVAIIIFVNATLWIALAPNLAKSIPMKPRGIKVFLWVMASNFLIPVAIGSLALLWLGPGLAGGLSSLPELVGLLPQWAHGALVSGIALSLIFILKLNLKAAALDFIALTNLKSRTISTVISAAAVLAVLFLFSQQPENQTVQYLVNIFALVAVVLAGWLGMLVADVALRRIAYHELSLTRAYGYYGKFNLISFFIWFVSLVAGILIVPINLYGFGFTGIFAGYLGLDSTLGSQAIGFCLVLLIGLLLTVVARVPQIRKQEREVLAVESRRDALNDIFVGQD